MNLNDPGKSLTTAGDADPKAAFAGLSPEELAGKNKGHTLPAQLLVFGIVLCVSAVSLWWMRREGTKAGVIFDLTKVEYSEPDAEKARTYARIMTDLARIQTPLDVALGEFGKSPFMLDSGGTAVSDANPIPAGPSPQELAEIEARERAEARKQELLTAAGALRLQSVIEGRRPLARIDEHTVAVGDTIGEFFTVTAIDGRSVTIAADGQTFTLSMEDRKADSPKKAPVKMGVPTKRGGK